MTTIKINLDWRCNEILDWDDDGSILDSWFAIHNQYICTIERIAKEAYAFSVIHGSEDLPPVEDSLVSSWEEAEAAIKAIIGE